jgi:hypothetical protein
LVFSCFGSAFTLCGSRSKSRHYTTKCIPKSPETHYFSI